VTPEDNRHYLLNQPVIALTALILIGVCFILLQTPNVNLSEPIFQLQSSYFILNIKIVSIILAYIALTYFSFYPKHKQPLEFEFLPLFLISILATFLLVSSAELLSFYLSLELQSFCFYILTAYNRKSIFSTEAGIKYFILGAFSSCLILYAIAQIYLISGTLNLVNLRRYFSF
jgi:NADH-quinone oxidoreductase subunit N